MHVVDTLPRRIEATDRDLGRGRAAAHAIAESVTGRDPGPMATATSMSHYVYLGADVVVKLVDAGGHTRLDLEIELAPHLPAGLGAPLLAHGRFQRDTYDVRYACFSRVPGVSPGVRLPGIDAATVRVLAAQAVERLHTLHAWTPAGDAAQAIRNSPVFEGFVGRDTLHAEIERLVAADRDMILPRRLTDGLASIADQAPQHARVDVPVHADCDWGNWLVHDGRVTALLDFERTRLGDPADDWALLAVTSGPHLSIILDAIVEATAVSPETLRAECEVRDAAFLADDLGYAFTRGARSSARLAARIDDLVGLVDRRRWWS